MGECSISRQVALCKAPLPAHYEEEGLVCRPAVHIADPSHTAPPVECPPAAYTGACTALARLSPHLEPPNRPKVIQRGSVRNIVVCFRPKRDDATIPL
jgi:hypothetical protein